MHNDGDLIMNNEPTAELQQRIESIEAGYEFMLAYAAQGHATDRDLGPGQNIRKYLQEINSALNGMSETVRAVAESKNPDGYQSYSGFLEALDGDVVKSQGAIKLVLAQASISSQLIDNLNASIHLRALLTDLFVLDEALKS